MTLWDKAAFVRARARVSAAMSAKSFDPSDADDRACLLAMFRRIPVELLEERAMHLLFATRTVRTSRAMKPGPEGVPVPDTIQEPENGIIFNTWRTIVEQRAGGAPARKPVEPPPPERDDKPSYGILRAPRETRENPQG